MDEQCFGPSGSIVPGGSIAPSTCSESPAVRILQNGLSALTAVDQDIVLLDYGTVVMRRGYHTIDKVRILSGGMADNDVNHALFVGKGMLTGAILGDSVAPSSRQILHTIKELNQGDNFGIIVIVNSASSDMFNFGLAVERANVDCQTRVKLLIVDDDKNLYKDRSSCGIILMIKVMGAMAERGLILDDIYNFCSHMNENIATVYLKYEQREAPRKCKIIVLDNFEIQVQPVIVENLETDPIPTVALINTPKSMDRISELALVKLVIEGLQQLDVRLVRIYYGNFLSIADGAASLTLMRISDDTVIQYLEDHCSVSGWHHVNQYLPEITLQNEIPGLLKHHGKQLIPLKGAIFNENGSQVLMTAVEFACAALISCERQLNTIDAEKSSGNIGTRLKSFAENVNKRLRKQILQTECPYVFFKKLGIICESALSGTLGSIYGVFFENAANVFGELSEKDHISSFIWAKALTAGSDAVGKLCNEEKALTSIYYPIKCCEKAITEEMQNNPSWMQCYGLGVTRAEEAAEKTRTHPSKHPDAGAHSVGIWMRAVFEAVKLMSSFATYKLSP